MAITDRLRTGLLALALLGLAGGVPAAAQAQSARPAFPGATGYGAGATGWRGGALIAVTNLRDSGPGSLRACAEGNGPRLCIFRVTGTIQLSKPLMVRSNVYIAGQTAPGKGIQLRVDPRSSTHGPMVIKNASDVVVRFLKLRPGATAVVTSNIDALTVENASNLYLGNLSLMFSTDETFNIHVNNNTAINITLADSILAFSLDHSNHPEAPHSKGALICSFDGTGNECGRITLLRNVFAHHRDRNPDLKGSQIGPVEVINNIFYDPISQFGEFYDLLGDTQIAYVGNLALAGPSTISNIAGAVDAFDWTDGNDISIWAKDNLARRCASGAALPVLSPAAKLVSTTVPIPLAATAMPASAVAAALPPRSGDVLPGGGHRDALDQRALNDVAQCRGKVIDSPGQVGGWPNLGTAPAPADSDGDLLPDDWERRVGLNPARPDDPWADPDGNGLSTVETWLAELAGDA